jgi:transcriptional regulator with XRE-family HTH domain
VTFNIETLSSEALAAGGRAIKSLRDQRGWSQGYLAKKSGCDQKQLRAVERGKREIVPRKFPLIVVEICSALGVSPAHVYQDTALIKIAGKEYGAYSLAHYDSYVGVYWAFRRSFSVPENILRTVFQIAWSDEKSCLEFIETQEYIGSRDGRERNYSQKGDIYIDNEYGVLHLLTRGARGALRLITLSKLRGNTLRGVVLTQFENEHHHHLPAASPIYLQKAHGVAESEDIAHDVGAIPPTHELFPAVAACISEVERETIHCAPIP